MTSITKKVVGLHNHYLKSDSVVSVKRVQVFSKLLKSLG